MLVQKLTASVQSQIQMEILYLKWMVIAFHPFDILI